MVFPLKQVSVLIFILATQRGSGQRSSTSSLFQCQPSSQQEEMVFTPNIPDSYFNHTAVASSFTGSSPTLMRSGSRYIIPLPSLSPQRNCNGSIISIEYCYAARERFLNRTNIIIFTFFSLTQNELQFTIDQRLNVRSSPSLQSICSRLPSSEDIVCCDKTVLQPQGRPTLPSSSYAFGMVARRLRQFVAFSDSVSQYHTLHFQQSRAARSVFQTRNFTLTRTNQFSNRSIPLLRLTIDADATIDFTTPESTTSDTENNRAGTTFAVSDESANQSVLTGGIVGALLAIIITITGVIAIIIILQKRRKLKKQETMISNTYASVIQVHSSETAIASKEQPPTFMMTFNESYNSTIQLSKEAAEPYYDTPTVGAHIPPTAEPARFPQPPDSDDEGYSCSYDYIDPL